MIKATAKLAIEKVAMKIFNTLLSGNAYDEKNLHPGGPKFVF